MSDKLYLYICYNCGEIVGKTSHKHSRIECIFTQRIE